MNEQKTEFPHLKKAPITEAIIDLRVRLPDGFEIARFQEAHSGFKADYPNVEEQKIVQQEFQQTSGKLPVLNVRDLGLVGFFFRSADNKQIIQFRKDGFTFNRLHPYTSWEEIFPEASRYWKVYAQIASPEEITRIAVRYINRLLLPGPELRFADYLTAPLHFPRLCQTWSAIS